MEDRMTIELPLAAESPRLEINLRNTPLTVEPSADGTAWARFVPEHGEAPRHARERFAVRAREADDGGPPVATLDERPVDDAEKGTLRVQLPASTQLRLRSRNGAMQVRDLAGRLNARTRNGAINVRHHRGPLRLAAANGAIDLSDSVAAQLEVSAANGSVNLSDIETSRLQVATSNGRVRVARGRIGGGTVRCANGRIALQVAPLTQREPAADPAQGAGATDADAAAELPQEADPETGAGDTGHADGPRRLAVYSANGPITVALPEQVSATVKARTLGVMRNYLGSARTRTERGVTTLQFGAGSPELLVLINNLRGGIEVMKHADFETGRRDHEEEFSHHDPHHEGVWFDVDFSEEFPRFMRDMKEFGMKFGRLGEEVSREMRRAFKFGGPGAGRHEHRRHRGYDERDDAETRAEARQEDSGEQIKTVLNLLQEGKISVEDAEKLIAALRR
jgi:hypothetical protein